MAENSKIAWTNHTFNPWIGCTRVSPGCQNCYAENLMDRRYQRVKWGKGQPRSRTKTWNDPIKWNKEAERTGQRFRVFCASLADWLDEEVPAQWREDLFDLIERCPHLDWLMLTKRIGNAMTMLPNAWLKEPLPHVWMGVTAENQEWWNRRVPVLESVPAALRWVSYEPALGYVNIGDSTVDWVIIGGESQQTMGARVFDMAWARSMIGQCRDRGIKPFMKQVGSNVMTHVNHLWTPKDKAGADPAEWPEAVRVREFPISPALV